MLLCILCLAADLARCAYRHLVSCLPNDMSPDPAESGPCQQCMPHFPSASLGAQSQPAGKTQQTIIQVDSGNAALCQDGMYGTKARGHAVLHFAKHCLQQDSVCFTITGEAAEKAFNSEVPNC